MVRLLVMVNLPLVPRVFCDGSGRDTPFAVVFHVILTCSGLFDSVQHSSTVSPSSTMVVLGETETGRGKGERGERRIEEG